MNHYQILKLSPEATDAEVRASYAEGLQQFRDAAKRGDSLDPSRLDALREAFSILSNPEKRAAYDQQYSPQALPSSPAKTTEAAEATGASDTELAAKPWSSRLKLGVSIAAFAVIGILASEINVSPLSGANSKRSVAQSELTTMQEFYSAKSKKSEDCLLLTGLFLEAFDLLESPETYATVAFLLLKKHESKLTQEQKPRFSEMALGVSLAAYRLKTFGRDGASVAYAQACRLNEVNTSDQNQRNSLVTISTEVVKKAMQCEKGPSQKECIALAFSTIAQTPKNKIGDSYCHQLVSKIDESGAKLVAAGQCGNISLVRELLDAGATISASDPQFKKTALHFAAERGHLEIVRLLLDRGAEVDIVASGYTPLIFASVGGHAEVVKLLLQRGANPNREYIYGTPLIAAIKHRNYSVAEELLKSGADVNFANGETALHALVRESFRVGDEKFIELLLRSGANPIAKDGKGATVLDVANYNAKNIIESKRG